MDKKKLSELLAGYTMDAAPELAWPDEKEAGAVRCVACGHRCLVREGRAGICRVRSNEGGTLKVPAGYVAGLQVDPIEKKPFFHAFPGHNALSFGMLGCDFHCSYCQNWVTSQALRDDQAIALPSVSGADELVMIAQRENAPVIVSTYNEPLITADWAMEVFRRARKQGIVCGFVSNGNATPEVLDYLRPCTDLYKIDLKGFNDKRYRQLGGVLKNVLKTIEMTKERGYWVEIVTLIVPGFNDNEEEYRGMAEFLAGVDPAIPWHVTAFHPDYKMTDPPATPASELLKAYDIGKEAGLQFIYPGNLPGGVGDKENTYCPQCEGLLIERRGFYVIQNRMVGSHCPDCEAVVPGVWESAAPKHSVGNGLPRGLRLRK